MFNKSFSAELEKLAFNLTDGKRLTRIFKNKRVHPKLVPENMKQLGYAAGGNNDIKTFASLRGATKEEGKDFIAGMGFKNGKTVMAPEKGDVNRFATKVQNETGLKYAPAKKMTGRQRHMNEATVKTHELDEMQVKPKGSFVQFGHNSPDVILREHNRSVTMPKEFEPVRRHMKKVRNIMGDAQTLKDTFPQFNYGSGQRLSRHARKRMTDVMERNFNG